VKVRRHPEHAGLGSRVRVRPWAFERGVVQLALADQGIVPTVDEVRGWVETLGAGDAGLRSIRTGALFSAAADRFAAAGFEVIDTLALLRIELAATDRRALRRQLRGASGARLRPRRHADAARVDREAFGDPWGNDAADLAEIRRATPTHRARARFARHDGHRELVAFAITGAASGHGYLQRLAVAPAHQGRGHGRALVLDSLTWMHRRRLSHGLVNTAVDNDRALRLYESVGFRQLPERLVVMQLDVTAAGAIDR
jgi:ribosomal protein S18 acetylase RimI-like enzyme